MAAKRGRNPGGRPPKYDWTRIRDEYVTGPESLSLRKLAAKLHMKADTLYKHSAEEDWEEQRRQYRDRISRETKDALATAEVDVRKRHSSIAQALMGFAVREFQKLVAVQEELAEEGRPNVPLIDIAEIRRLVETAATLEKAALGIGVDAGIETKRLNSDQRARKLSNTLSFYIERHGKKSSEVN